MTTAYDSDHGVLTNNNAETYNFRMKKMLGDHPTLPKFLACQVKENATIELQWLQRDRPKSTQARRLEDREKFRLRKEWEDELRRRMESSLSNEDMLDFLDRMSGINRASKKKKLFAPSYPARGSRRGRGNRRGPVRAQTERRSQSSSSSIYM